MRAVVLVVPPAEAELASDALWCAGAQAVEERAAGGRAELWSALSSDDATSRALLGPLPAGWEVRFVEVDEAPAETWRELACPIEIGSSLVLRPAWLPPLPERPGVIQIAVEPGGAFGLGDHPTTRLSAAAVARLVRPGDRVLDVGCGSGVLSVVAARCGAADVVAVDVSDLAVEAARANAARNGVAAIVAAGTAPLAAVEGRFDLVVANILAPTLVALAGDLCRLTGPDGHLVLSGVLAGHYDHVVAAMAPMQLVAADDLDGWSALELRWRPTP